jgi:hypothetical protein
MKPERRPVARLASRLLLKKATIFGLPKGARQSCSLDRRPPWVALDRQ